MPIRLVTDADAAALQAIYAPYVTDTTISFELEAPTVEQMRERIAKTAETHPWLVYVVDDAVAGYAYATKHRERAAYQWSVDVSVYVSPAHQRKGIGRKLYGTLFPLLKLQGFCNAYAGVALPNEASTGVHAACGFKLLGVYHSVGYKFGKWHDVSWWELRLQDADYAPSTPLTVRDVINTSAGHAALESVATHIRL